MSRAGKIAPEQLPLVNPPNSIYLPQEPFVSIETSANYLINLEFCS